MQRQADEKALKKLQLALNYLEEGDYAESDRLFRVSGILCGQALAAFLEKRYERAINKSVRSLAALNSGAGKFEDPLISIWVMKKSRDALSGETGDAANQGLVEETDGILGIFGTDGLSRACEYIRRKAEDSHSLVGPLCDRRSNVPMSERLLVAAFSLLVAGEDYHRASEIFGVSCTVSGTPRPAYTYPLCPVCYHRMMEAEGECRDDAFHFRKIVFDEMEALTPAG